MMTTTIVNIAIKKGILGMINIKTKIFLKTSQDVKDFVFTTSQFSNSVQVKVKHGDSVADGKSILGLLSINTKGVLDLEVIGDNSMTEQETLHALNNWIMEGEKS